MVEGVAVAHVLRNGAAAFDLADVARCGAKTRAGGACRQPAMACGKCRLHGGLSTGPRTEAGRASVADARTTVGRYTALAIRRRFWAREMVRRGRGMAEAGRQLEATRRLTGELRAEAGSVALPLVRAMLRRATREGRVEDAGLAVLAAATGVDVAATLRPDVLARAG